MTNIKTSIILTVLIGFLFIGFNSSPAVASTVGQNYSRVSTSKTELKADGIDNATITVTIKDQNMLPLTNKTVVLTSSRGALDEIRAEKSMTDTLGKAYFRVFSLRDGVATFSAKIDDVILNMTVTLTFSGGLGISLTTGDLIKIPDDGNVDTLNDTAVYYYASNGKRFVFSNEKVYYSWYQNFSKVQIIPIDQMSLIPIGGNVTYRPGTRMVKFQTDPKTYMVTKGGTLRWAKTEEVARGWFGHDWNQYVDDITEAFYVNYKFGEPVSNSMDLVLEVIRDSVPNIDVDKGLSAVFK